MHATGALGEARAQESRQAGGSAAIGGTVAWMAPELLRCDDTITSAVDVYAMGMVIYEAFTGKVPFSGLHMGAILAEVVTQQKRPPMWEPASEAEKLAVVLMQKCWGHEPLGRPSANECLAEALQIYKVAESEKQQGLQQGLPAQPPVASSMEQKRARCARASP